MSVMFKSGFLKVFRAEESVPFNLGYVICALSFALFYLNTTFGFLPKFAPPIARRTEKRLWKWRNTANSMLHSFISGSWAVLSFWQTPEIREDLIQVYTYSTWALVSMSIGYFIYDFIDMAVNWQHLSTKVLLLHHVLVVFCFGLSMTTRYYNGYALVALLVEVNSVFLHLRQLLLLQGWQKDQIVYKIVSYFNLGTFIVFRLITLAWLIQWLVFHRNEFSLNIVLLGYISNSVFLILSFGMLLRIINKDFYTAHDANKIGAKTE